MAKLEQYTIDLKALQDTVAGYEYELGDDFFEMLDASEVQKGSVHVSLEVKKLAGSFELNFSFAGMVTVICDRCLDEMSQPVSSEDRLYVKFGEEFSDEGDEVIVVPENEGTVNVAWFIYEFIALAIPIRHVHPAGECNAEMLDKLSQHVTYSLADDVADAQKDDLLSDSERRETVDPRWNDLKNLLDNN